MTLIVNRIGQGNNSTLSEIHLDGAFVCYGLEDPVRDVKVKGSTAIPAGIYPLLLNTYGAMNARYKRKFPKIHRGMIEIAQIPDYAYVYIHIGNNFGDTSGCLLVGKTYIREKEDDKDYELRQSRQAYVDLYKRLITRMQQGQLYVEIKDERIKDERNKDQGQKDQGQKDQG